MKISIVTDEISADPETAIELGVSWGVSNFELRGIATNRVPLFSSFQQTHLKELIKKFDVNIVAISPGLFKCPYPLKPRMQFPVQAIDQVLYQRWRSPVDVMKYHVQELLPLSISYAQEMGVQTIVAFSFERSGVQAATVPDEIQHTLYEAAAQVEAAGLQLVLEVEADYWADTGANSAALIQAVNHPALAINWDPGNAFAAGDTPYPDGYEAVRQFVRHVHFKDVAYSPEDGYCYRVNGAIDWEGQIKALAKDKYTGYISVESHMQPKVQSSQLLTQRLQTLVTMAAI